MRCTSLLPATALSVFLLTLTSFSTLADEPDRMLAHDVYFSLVDDSAQTQEALIAACQKYLSGHPGTIWFAAGPLAKEMQGDVNDQEFDVALHLVFKNKAALEMYAKSDRHQKFIDEMQSSWNKVRVFDSYVAASSHEGMAAPGDHATAAIPKLPDAAAGFAGMIRGKVVHTVDRGLLVKVADVSKVWEHNRAQDAQSLVGKTVLVRPGEKNRLHHVFMRLVHPGEEVTLDVAHRDGEALILLELTQDQRERVQAARVEQ
jgi:hypothetical protein